MASSPVEDVTCPQSYKTFYGRGLRISVISFSAYKPGLPNTSLVRKLINYRQKEFYNIGACIQSYKTFCLRHLRGDLVSWSVCPWPAFPP
jgi:hypothetical protein